MIRKRRLLTAVAMVCTAAFVLTACGSDSGSSNEGTTAAGDPVSGGAGRAIMAGEPRSLDPATLSNTWAHQGILGNSLYGTLMINDTKTLDVTYTMAEDFSTADGGATFNLKLRPNLKFSDGTPLDAEAVKFNWERLKDPALGSTSARYVAQIANLSVVDPANLAVTMVTPTPHYSQTLIASSMNWIASPAALQKGQAGFDENPIGAGPFTLTKWARQDSIELAKNPTYYDAPRPYLDTLTIRVAADTNQRYNTLSTGGADLINESNWQTLDTAETAGFPTEIVPMGGGQYLSMNFRRAPFNDERARRAVSLAVDLDAMNTVVYSGKGEVPETLFQESSPFYADIKLGEYNKAEAQKLFDELAAEGKPVSFTFTSYPTAESKTAGEALQAQLSAYKNVEAKVDVVDYAAATAKMGTKDFDMVISSAIIQDPDSMWSTFHNKSPGNIIGVDDQELSDALDVGRTSQSQDERKAAYTTVQERLADLTVGLWYIRAAPSTVTGKDVQGVTMYGSGSPLTDAMWIAK
ncbi:ABC transporter substrate-binding protein [Rhodococcus sp. ACPA4]|uniref:Peptide/nickel transport system substrate-binding protein n=2 Tax=Nocardiaceae TaxID=85025 RepID=A0A652YKS4_NOCGL|nr:MULTISPECIES: ABC transporter substrate-binding protein [Rhodococcus]NMD60317.1 ABC transporter substrate-binding protein [Nocardia globerula]KJF23949.1 Glutathione-binding protein gsiB precursor [Rhodococcus sp. AD45]MCE4266339.1 ABC transporter substrate-binding protein [Rhodococcus globerulus]MDV6270762.1 ABC transporter substrate-binding protein [Rhodococcus globerulus]NRI69303.1 ABC transporter substrate-binding protein [Rhodococcus sp. MS16]